MSLLSCGEFNRETVVSSSALPQSLWRNCASWVSRLLSKRSRGTLMPHVTVTWHRRRFKSDKFSNRHALLQVSHSCSWPGCLQETVCRLFCEPASEEASFWDDGHANRLVAVCGVWSKHWQADLPLLQPLKQCWQHSCVCFLKPASAPDAPHKNSTSLIDPCEACSEWNPSW